MRGRACRRYLTERKVRRRLHLIEDLGYRGGVLYVKHIEKVKTSGGYVRDGNVKHYASTYPSNLSRRVLRLKPYDKYKKLI